MIDSRATSPAGKPTFQNFPRSADRHAAAPSTLNAAIDSLELQVTRLEDWRRRFGLDHDRSNLVALAIEQLRIQIDRLKKTGDDTRPLFGQTDRPGPCIHGFTVSAVPGARQCSICESLTAAPRDVPLVITGQGSYRREVCGDPATGRLNVQG